MDERQWRSTGHHVEANQGVYRIPPFDDRTRAHFWMVLTGYRVVPEMWDDPTATPILDSENLVTVSPPFCYYCEEPYSTRLGHRRCTGDPE